MLYLAADHRGFKFKEELKKYLIEQGYEVAPIRGATQNASPDAQGRLTSNGVIDIGALEYDGDDDYVDFARAASEKIVSDPSTHKGIFICGSGHGTDIVANKFKGIRAALGFNVDVVKQSREHEDTNVLILASDWVEVSGAKEIVLTWLNTEFRGEERHVRRLKKIKEIEAKNFRNHAS